MLNKHLHALLLFLFLLPLPISGCSEQTGHTEQREPSQTAMIDWADFVKINGVTYDLDLSVVLHDPSVMQNQTPIGHVRQRLDGNVHDPAYHTVNGDAGFLPVGTPIYSIPSERDAHPEYVAVPFAQHIHGYRIYRKADPYKATLHVSQLPRNQVTEADLFLGNQKIASYSSAELPSLYSALDHGRPPKSVAPLDVDKPYQLVFYTPQQPLAYSYPLQSFLAN